MDSQTLDIIQVHVPQDDGSLSRAIAELERRLSTYSASLRAAHQRLRGAVTTETAPAVSAVKPETPVTREAVVSPPIQPAAEPEPSPAPLPPKVVPTVPAVEETPSWPAEQVPASPESPAESSQQNDEALLASLDTVTAERIRVLRRLCDRKKSVRELLSELEATKPLPPPAQTKKRSWFSKG